MAESLQDIRRPNVPRAPIGAAAFDVPAERSFGQSSGAALRAAYQTEAEKQPWVIRSEESSPGQLSEEDARAGNEAAALLDEEELVLLERLETERTRTALRTPQTLLPGAGPAEYRSMGDQSSAAYRRFHAALMVARRTQQEHRRLEASLKRGIRKTFVLVVAIALFCALLADVLSLADLGWVVSWSIPLFTGIMLSRMNSMNKSHNAIVEARTAAQRAVVVAQQRLRQAGLVSASTPIARAQPLSRANSYVGTYIRDTVIVQFVELIPIIDFLPMYLGQVVKMIANQNSAYRSALKEFRLLETEHRALQALQQRELAAYVSWLVESQVPDGTAPALARVTATA